MRAGIGPGVRQIFSPQGRVGVQQVSLARTERPGLDEHPNRDASPHDARLTAADAGRGLDPWKGITQIAHNPLKQLGLLGAGDLLEQTLNVVDSAHGDDLHGCVRFQDGRHYSRLPGAKICPPGGAEVTAPRGLY